MDQLKTVVLAGGLGSRLAEETEIVPKPLIEIGGRPILWHILKHFSHFGFRDFYLALGYKGEKIKDYFLNYSRLSSSLTLDLKTGHVEMKDRAVEDWRLHLVDTGQHSGTGGRIGRLKPYLQDGTFFLTYGDGVSDVNLHALLARHREQGRIVTVSAVRPPARFGGLLFDGDLIANFTEKPQISEGWINGGFMAVEPAIFDYIAGDEASLEVDVLERLAADGQLAAYRHEGFWQCMDTLRDKRLLESLWRDTHAPWKVWQE